MVHIKLKNPGAAEELREGQKKLKYTEYGSWGPEGHKLLKAIGICK